MARRKRPTVTGSDPAYSHTFEAKRPQLPNGMPPTVRIPGADDGSSVATPPPNREDPVAAPSNEPEAPEVVTADPGPATDPASETPEATRDAPAPKAKPARRAKAKAKAGLAARAKDAAMEPKPEAPAAKMRRVTIKAAITTAHVEAIEPLVANGLAQRDVLAVAGRRAIRRFDPVAEFVPLPEGDRVALAQGYVTSKLISADLLDGLRQVHDPLRLRSDAAMVRGQFEILFWSVLEEVIEELGQQKV